MRTVYVVKTNLGLEGYGESHGPAPEADLLAEYIGTDPFDWIAEPKYLWIGSAMYDLMGKFLGLPTWKLLGQKVRDWVPVAQWTVSQPPDAMAVEARHAARLGYRWLKFHVDEMQNVIDQTAAIQQVAPPGFKVHYDFNADGDLEAVFPVLEELERFPVAARVEDPIRVKDHDGYRILREKSKLSILIHHGSPEVMVDHLCDGYMAGHASVGHALRVAAVAEATNTPFMLQQVGGTINQAFLAHEAAVFKMATLDHVNLAHLWKEDVTTETMPIVSGSVQVPKGPGLGVTLDRAKLEKHKSAPRRNVGRFLVRVKHADGLRVYFRYDPAMGINHLRHLHRTQSPGPVPAYANPIATDFWDDDDSHEFQRIWQQTESGPAGIPR
jgi:L-alanine-DL-glutamate epimerase-like enolase superfamily enzyme